MPQSLRTQHPDGITAVDAEYVRPGKAAAHLVVHQGHAAFVDPATNHSVPYLLDALAALGVPREAVDYVFLTHVHLDHAGGAGLLMQSLPHARAVLHPRGAPHMADPSALVAASRMVYGEEKYQSLYGDLVPIPESRIDVTQDGQRFSLAGRDFQFLHTPGHAMHHHAIVDVANGNIFTGDTFGLSYRETDTAQGSFIVPTTTPTQFDPDQLIASVRKLAALKPKALYLMHYSRVTDVPRLADSMEQQVREFVEIAKRHAGTPDARERMREDMRSYWFELVRRHGCVLPEAELDEVFGSDLDLNTDGLVAWLKRVSNPKR